MQVIQNAINAISSYLGEIEEIRTFESVFPFILIISIMFAACFSERLSKRQWIGVIVISILMLFVGHGLCNKYCDNKQSMYEAQLNQLTQKYPNVVVLNKEIKTPNNDTTDTKITLLFTKKPLSKKKLKQLDDAKTKIKANNDQIITEIMPETFFSYNNKQKYNKMIDGYPKFPLTYRTQSYNQLKNQNTETYLLKLINTINKGGNL